MSASNYYVYYRIDPARLEELRRSVATLFESIARDCGVQGRWMRRRDDPSTYMEVYEGVADAALFESRLLAEVDRLGFARSLEKGSTRHVECFVAAEG
jgi:hypothetical protein